MWVRTLLDDPRERKDGVIVAFDDQLAHAREFTDIENPTLDLWLTLELAGLDDNARTLLDAGLLFEHYTSLLPSELAQRTPAQLAQQAALSFRFQDEVRKAHEALNALAAKREATRLKVIQGGHEVP